LYATDSARLLGDSLEDIVQFEGREGVEAELAETALPTDLTSALLSLSITIVGAWWTLCLHGFAALLVLVTGDRRTRAAGAALLSVWLAIALGTVLTHGGLWRYSMQLAPLTLMLASAGGAIVVTSLIDFRRRAGSRA
jgi:hypothetical protein